MPRPSRGTRTRLLRILQAAALVLLADEPVHGRRPPTPASGPGRGGHNSTGERDEYRMKTVDDYWNSPLGKDLQHPDLTNASSHQHREFKLEFRVKYAMHGDAVV